MQERERIARDLHDGVSQRLASLGFHLSAAAESLGHDDATAAAGIRQARELGVADNGIGPAVKATRPTADSYGMQTMRERADMVGGAVHLRTRRGGGTIVVFTVPVSALEAAP